MLFFENHPLTRYATPPNNYIGSTLFLSYIVVALYLTSTTAYSLYSQYISVFYSLPSSPASRFKRNDVGEDQRRNARARHIKIYTAFALISFTSISWHMLGFLITSFLDWNNSLTRNIFDAVGNNMFDKLKRWMLETSLFNDFAVQLVGDGESAVWSQLAILTTWSWNLWIGKKSSQYGFNAKTTIPFIILGQNLPISFTAALFIIQLHLMAPDVVGKIQQETKRHERPQKKPIASVIFPTILLNAILLAQPSLRGHSGFSYLLFAERLLLLLPHTGLLKLNDADIKKSAAISGGFIVANWAILRKNFAVRDVMTALVYRGQAVKTMGWDAVLSAILYGVLSWGGGI